MRKNTAGEDAFPGADRASKFHRNSGNRLATPRTLRSGASRVQPTELRVIRRRSLRRPRAGRPTRVGTSYPSRCPPHVLASQHSRTSGRALRTRSNLAPPALPKSPSPGDSHRPCSRSLVHWGTRRSSRRRSSTQLYTLHPSVGTIRPNTGSNRPNDTPPAPSHISVRPLAACAAGGLAYRRCAQRYGGARYRAAHRGELQRWVPAGSQRRMLRLSFSVDGSNPESADSCIRRGGFPVAAHRDRRDGHRQSVPSFRPLPGPS